MSFSAAAVYNQIYSKLSTNQKQSYICKSAIYAHWNGLSKLSTNQKQSFICKSAIVLSRRDTKDIKQYLIKCFKSLTRASLLSMLIETDYNFKKITAIFFGPCLKEFHSVWNWLFIKQNANFFQHNRLLFEICLGYLFCSIRWSTIVESQLVWASDCDNRLQNDAINCNRFPTLVYRLCSNLPVTISI